MTGDRSGTGGSAAAEVELRPFTAADLDLFVRYTTDPAFSAPFAWAGFRSPEDYVRRFHDDAFLAADPRQLAIDEGAGAVGWVLWRDPLTLGRPRSSWEIGVLVAPESRGRGVGTAAHRLLVDHLFDTTPVPRVTANTDVANTVERRCLERCGFQLDGVLRQAGYRSGQWRDVATYSLLADEWAAADPSR